MFKQSFDVYERNLGSILEFLLAVTVGLVVTLLDGRFMLRYVFDINNFISYLLVTVGIALGALVYQAVHTHNIKKHLREHAKWRFDEVLEKGVAFAIKEAYKDLNASGELHSSKLALLFAQANNAATIATLGDMDTRYVLKAFQDTLEAGRKSSKVTADSILNITINISSWGFDVYVRLGGEILNQPEGPGTHRIRIVK